MDTLAATALPRSCLADRVGITPANLAVRKNGRAKAVRFTTLAALCEVLQCQPGDLLRWEPEPTHLRRSTGNTPVTGTRTPANTPAMSPPADRPPTGQEPVG
ncbi:helix-turn-helix domain-containing protein [Streptomyces xinghaiensis]|uniref:helix-turn-helix domain-containing protein n=1 Tax=Streptomyces xinghaiensis TaxID=1038928 RepID=UPI001EE0269C|nr:helix-turn-helix domain-containing protein [Streptomyces xinghaiensis]